MLKEKSNNAVQQPLCTLNFNGKNYQLTEQTANVITGSLESALAKKLTTTKMLAFINLLSVIEPNAFYEVVSQELKKKPKETHVFYRMVLLEFCDSLI